MPALTFAFFLLAFYAALQRFTGKTMAALATLLMMITPEMIAFSSLSATNVIHAVYASLGIIYTFIWLQSRETKDLLMASILLGLNIFCRSEGIVFIGAAFCVVLFDAWKTRHYKSIALLSLSLVPFVLWQVFMKVFNLYAEGILITKPFWDATKLATIYTYMKALYVNTQYYGWTFIVFLGAIVANIYYTIRQRNQLSLLVMIVLSSLFYMVVLYQIDYKWDSITNVLLYSAKRFMFCFIPCIWFYAATVQPVQFISRKVESFLSYPS